MTAVLQTVCRAFGLDPGRLVPVASAYRSVAAYRAGPVLLKPYRYTEQQLYYATGGLEHLSRQGFGLVPWLVRTRAGEPYIRLGGQLWYATTWVEGRAPRFPRDLPEAARSVGLFHQASEGFFMPYSASRSWRRRWEGLLNDLYAFASVPPRDPFDRAYAAAAPGFITRAQAALAALGRSGYDRLERAARDRRAFCHRDCTASNLVVRPSGQVCLVDPDTWGPELRLHDLTRLFLSGGVWRPGAMLQALAAYEAVLPLDPAERRLLPAALALPREFWWAGVCRYRKPAVGVDPAALLASATAGAPARDACVQALRTALDGD